MNGFDRHQHPPAAAPIRVHVEIKGSLDIPLQLGLLAELGDPMIEQEILKEAVRIAVSEKLGCFDGVDVRLSSSGGREAAPSQPNGAQRQQQTAAPSTATAAAATATATRRSNAQRYCEADVDLQRLGGCIEAIQGAYEHLLVHLHLLHDVLHGAAAPLSSTESPATLLDADGTSVVTPLSVDAPSDASRAVLEDAAGPASAAAGNSPSASMNGNSRISVGCAGSPADLSAAYADALQRLAAAQRLVDTALRDRQPDVVQEAAAHHNAEGLRREGDMLEQERDCNGGRHGSGSVEEEDGCVNGLRRVRPRMDHEDGVDAELRRGLLADEDESDNAGGSPLDNEDERDDDDVDEEALHERYVRQGYSPL